MSGEMYVLLSIVDPRGTQRCWSECLPTCWSQTAGKRKTQSKITLKKTQPIHKSPEYGGALLDMAWWPKKWLFARLWGPTPMRCVGLRSSSRNDPPRGRPLRLVKRWAQTAWSTGARSTEWVRTRTHLFSGASGAVWSIWMV